MCYLEKIELLIKSWDTMIYENVCYELKSCLKIFKLVRY